MKITPVSYLDKEVRSKFPASLVETGFGVLSDHPIPHQLIRDVFNDWENYFASEAKFKDKFSPETQSGYFPFKTENAKGYKEKDLKEFFHLHTETPLPAGMSGRTKELFQAMELLGHEMLKWIEEHSPVKIRKEFSMALPDMVKNSKDNLLRPIHYPPLTGSEASGAIRAAAHEDINLITLLPAATAPGLQVKDVNGQWYDVPCNPGDIVVNAGDMLQMASQGYYKSTTHQVINPSGPDALKPRYSMPLFMHPRPEVRLSPIHTARSYKEERLREIGLLKDGQKVNLT